MKKLEEVIQKINELDDRLERLESSFAKLIKEICEAESESSRASRKLKPESLLTYNRKLKPESKEEILKLFPGEDLSKLKQKDIIARIQKWYPNIGNRTIRRQMAKFGLTKKNYVRKDYKVFHDKIDELREDGTAAPITIDSPTSEIIDYIESSLR